MCHTGTHAKTRDKWLQVCLLCREGHVLGLRLLISYAHREPVNALARLHTDILPYNCLHPSEVETEAEEAQEFPQTQANKSTWPKEPSCFSIVCGQGMVGTVSFVTHPTMTQIPIITFPSPMQCVPCIYQTVNSDNCWNLLSGVYA